MEGIDQSLISKATYNVSSAWRDISEKLLTVEKEVPKTDKDAPAKDKAPVKPNAPAKPQKEATKAEKEKEPPKIDREKPLEASYL